MLGLLSSGSKFKGHSALGLFRSGNRAGRARLDRANSGPGQNRVGPKLARFFWTRILTAHPALKIGLVEPNSFFKAKKNSGERGRAGPGHAGPGHTGPGQIWPVFFRPII